MKKLTFSLLIALIVLMVVAACSSASTPTPTATTPPKATATSAPAVTRLTDAEMEALITEKAHDKHTLEFILSQNKTAEEWSTVIYKMIGFGAKISPDEKVMIID